MGSVEELSTTAGVTTTTTSYSAGGRRIAQATNGAFSYLGSDGLGSAEVALDGSGNAQASVLYDPYGSVRYSSGSMPGSYGYTGQRADAATGLDYYGARYYDAAAGQFTSADSVQDGLNRYAYVAGNPETRTDPTGHLFTCMDGCGGGGGSSGTPPPPPPPPTGGTPPSGGCQSGCNGRIDPLSSGSQCSGDDITCGCYTTCNLCNPLDYACEAHQAAISQERDLSKYRNILTGTGAAAALIRGVLDGAKDRIPLLAIAASYLFGAAAAAAVLSWVMWTILDTEIESHPDDSWYTVQNISQFFGGLTGAFVVYGAVDAVIVGSSLTGFVLSSASNLFATAFAGGALTTSVNMSIPGEIELATDEGDQVRPYTAR